MPAFLVVLSLPLISPFSQDQSQSATTLTWKQINSRYKAFDEIKPVPANGGKDPIFLSRLWFDGFVQLERLHEATGEWEYRGWGVRCGTVSNPAIPIEVSASGERKIQGYWQLSSDDWSRLKHFLVLESLANRPLEGRYRLALRYSLKPWTSVHHPDQIYAIRSPEFVVMKQAGNPLLRLHHVYSVPIRRGSTFLEL
jgi:hypothetical protein